MAIEQAPPSEVVAAPVVTANAASPAPVQENVSAPAAAPIATETAKPTIVETISEPTVLGVDDAASKTEAAPSETKVEAKPEVKTETAPEVKTEVKPEVKTEAKPVDAEKKPVEEKAPEVKPEDKPVEVANFEWKFPEDVTVDPEKVSEVNKIFSELANEGKIPHEVVQKYGQQLMDRYVSEVKSVADKLAEAYQKVWKDQTKGWYDAFLKDPEIGGNRKDTTVNAAREFIRRHGGTPEQQTEIRTLMQKTGLGNHPALIRLFSKANLSLREPTVVKAEAPPAQGLSMKQKMYGKNKKS